MRLLGPVLWDFPLGFINPRIRVGCDAIWALEKQRNLIPLIHASVWDATDANNFEDAENYAL